MKNKTFTVLTVSKREGWEGIAYESINRQTIEPKAWIAVIERKPTPISFFSSLYNGGIEGIMIEARKTKNPSNLNAAHNTGLKLIDTDYVIFYQDFIELPTDCFEKLLALAEPDTFVTTCTPNYDNSDDRRYLGIDQPRFCMPEEWEANVAIAPMKMLREIGGFDERLDVGWAWDNTNVALRAEMLGAKFIIDESNRPKLLPHELTSKLKMELNNELNAQLINDIRLGKAPLKLPYL